MKIRIHSFCVLWIIFGILGRMILRFLPQEHIFATQLLWGVVGAAAFLCLWTASAMGKEEKEKNGSVKKDTARLFLTDFILVALYVLSTIFMFF